MRETHDVVHAWDDCSVDIQDGQNALPAVRAARQRTRELLVGLQPALDIGCGPGSGALDLGAAAFGVDLSPTMTAEAHARGLAVARADAAALPLRSGCVGAVRCDRVLYHLTEPAAALAEAARVLRPAGRIVCAHPDHESIVLEVPGAPEHLVALAKWTRIELNYINGKIPRKVPKLLLDLGFSDVVTEAFTAVISDPDAPEYSVPTWLRSWCRQGKIEVTDTELRQWDDAIARARDRGGFLFTLTYLVTHATR